MRNHRKLRHLALPALLAALCASSAPAWGILALPARDIFGSDEQITRRSQKLAPDVCPTMPEQGKKLQLIEAINLVLCHNPDTQASWLSLRAQAAGQTAQKLDLLLPTVSADASLSKSATQVNSNGFITQGSGASISLGYTLFDFGRKQASLEAAEEAFSASIMNYDSGLQGVIGNTLRLYYSILTAQGALDVSRESLRFTEESVNAARARYELGLVPKSDVLQADTSLAQARLSVEQAENTLLLTVSDLAIAMGADPQTELQLADIDDSQLASDDMDKEVRPLMEAAKRNRIDLNASAASLRAARANLEVTRRSDLPQVSVSASQGFSDVDVFNRSTPRSGSIGLNVSIPLFTGLTRSYNVRAAEDSLKAQEIQFEKTKLTVMQDVWRSYTNYQTALQSWEVSWGYLASATELRDISLARYKEGIATMLDVLSAESQYRSATQQHLSARYNLLTSRADLVRSVGVLNLDTVQAGNPVDTLGERTGE